MLRNLTGKTLFEQRRGLLGWSVGTLALVLVVFAYYPSIEGNTELNRFYEDLPEAIRALSGVSGTDLTSPVGYLNSQLFANMAPILFIIFGVARGSGALGKEEETGTAELLLTLPVSRSRVVAEKAAAGLALLLALGAVLAASLVIGKQLVGMEIGLEGLLAASLATALIGIAFGAVALAISAALGPRGHSSAVTATLAVAAFLLYSLAPVVPSLDGWEKLSPFYWYQGSDPLANGFDLGHLAVLAAASVALTAAAAWLFGRRDVHAA